MVCTVLNWLRATEPVTSLALLASVLLVLFGVGQLSVSRMLKSCDTGASNHSISESNQHFCLQTIRQIESTEAGFLFFFEVS